MEHESDDESRLLDLLVRATAGKLVDPEVALPALSQMLSKDGGVESVDGTAEEVLQLLSEHEGEVFERLRGRIRERRLAEALRFHREGAVGGAASPKFTFYLGHLPQEIAPAWDLRDQEPGRPLKSGASAAEALAVLGREKLLDDLPVLAGKLRGVLDESVEQLRGGGQESLVDSESLDQVEVPEDLAVSLREKVERDEQGQRERVINSVSSSGDFPGDVSERVLTQVLRERVAESTVSEERRQILIGCCQWKTPALEPIVSDLCRSDARLGEVAALILRMRFGRAVTLSASVGEWFAKQRMSYQITKPEVSAAARLRLWAAGNEGIDDADLEQIDVVVARQSEETRQSLAKRWSPSISDEEWEKLTGSPRVAPVPVPQQPVVNQTPEVVARTPQEVPAPPVVKEKPPKRLPSLWSEHVRPFVVENWYMVAGIFMTIVGASLLAYYTWDRHWLIRYTLMPGMLALFTGGLARVGTWIGGKGKEFLSTASMLRGAAIGLLPVNFMAVALLSGDNEVANKVLAVSLMGLIYVALAGWGLWRWCKAEHPALGVPMGGTLLLLNALVVVGPLAGTHYDVVVGLGFYVGFALAAGVIFWFGIRLLSSEMLRERRVPAFFFIGLAATFLQVFLWVHGSARDWPQVHTYAPLLVMAGGLALFFDLRCLRLGKGGAGEEKLGGVAMLGFGLVFLGIVMSMADEYFRVLALFLGGLVWVCQAVWRRRLGVAHFWVGLTLLVLSVGSVGLLSGFPSTLIPALGMAVALVCLVAEPAARALRREFGDALRGMHFAALAIGVVVVVLNQWYLKTMPEVTAAWLVAIAALFGNGARREKNVRWVHVAMVVLALAVPYAGFANMRGQTVEGNTVVFGLSILAFLWIWMSSLKERFPTAARGRSTVLWFYGAVSVVAMIVRIFWQGELPVGDIAKFMDLGGPCLMAAALICASYFSRSLVAGGMAAVILVILFPELKASFSEVLPENVWGSGMGSVTTALGLVGLSFWLRQAPFLQNLQPGDRFLDRYDFPLRRFDHTLATWPLIGSALFLIGKIVIRNSYFYQEAGEEYGLLHGLAMPVAVAGCVALAIYLRKERVLTELLIHIAITVLSVGCLMLAELLLPEPSTNWGWVAFLGTAAAMFLGARFGLKKWAGLSGELAEPVSRTLLYWSVIVGFLALFNLQGMGVAEWCLVGLVVVVLAWQELVRRMFVHGVLLFLLVMVAILSTETDSEPTVQVFWIVLGIVSLATALQFYRKADDLFRPLMRIEIWLATALAIFSNLLEVSFESVLVDGVAMWFIVLGLAARLYRAGWLALLAMVSGFHWLATRFSDFYLFDSGFGGLAFVLAVSLPFAAWLNSLCSPVLQGLREVKKSWMRGSGIIVWSAVAFAILGCLDYQTARSSFEFAGFFHPADYGVPLPILAALALVVLAWFRRSELIGWMAIAAVNLVVWHFVRIEYGYWLAECGFGAVQMFALASVLTLAMILGLGYAAPKGRLRTFVSNAAGVVGMVALVALLLHVLRAATLGNVHWVSLLAGAPMAYLSGRGLRQAGREVDAKITPIYHLAVAVMVWCAAFAIPQMREFQLVVLGLFLPAVYFWWRAETVGRGRYALTATWLAGLATLAWVSKGAVDYAFFAERELPDSWFHFGAPVVVAAGVLMRRMKLVDGTPLMMVGLFFCVTAVPAWSPFTYPFAAALVAIVLGHAWIAAMHERSPLREVVTTKWAIVYLLVGIHAVILVEGFSHEVSDLVLLLLGAASVALHAAFTKRRYWLHCVAAVETLMALELEAFFGWDFEAGVVIWVLLGLWVVNLFFYDRIVRAVAPGGRNFLPLGIGSLVLANVILLHGAEKPVGLIAFAIGSVLAALTRIRGGASMVWLWLGTPVWFAFFLIWDGAGSDPTWATVVAIGMAIFVADVARRYQLLAPEEVRGSRLIHGVLKFMGENGSRFCAIVHYLALPLMIVVQLLQEGGAIGGNALTLVMVLYTFMAIYWARHERGLPRLVSGLIAQLSAFMMFFALRAQLVAASAWQPEFDVWATILGSFVLVGFRELGQRRQADAQLGMSLVISLCAMPLAGLLMVAVHGLGSNEALMVVGVQSMIFAYLGRGRRESPYNIVAIFGFVAFILIVFSAKLDLKVIHAYVVPAGLGVLLLVELFHRVIPAGTRNGVRLVTLLAMLGSTGYSALLDDSYPVVFHLTMLALCLACMGFGGLLRVRLFLLLGFTGLLVNLGSITYKVLVEFESGMRMTLVGSLVLIGGIGVLAAAIYYKTHRVSMDELINRFRQRLAAWE